MCILTIPLCAGHYLPTKAYDSVSLAARLYKYYNVRFKTGECQKLKAPHGPMIEQKLLTVSILVSLFIHRKIRP